MNLTLRRISYTDEGVFGNVFDESANLVFSTLEHSYSGAPKLPTGFYTCVRGFHRLGGMADSFQTFEVTGVPGHTGILWHVGNSQNDSSGCILVGTAIVGSVITESRRAFRNFMMLQAGVDSFELLVKA